MKSNRKLAQYFLIVVLVGLILAAALFFLNKDQVNASSQKEPTETPVILTCGPAPEGYADLEPSIVAAVIDSDGNETSQVFIRMGIRSGDEQTVLNGKTPVSLPPCYTNDPGFQTVGNFDIKYGDKKFHVEEAIVPVPLKGTETPVTPQNP